MRNYLIRVQHDTGHFSVHVSARNKKVAIAMITKSENCPASAIIKIIHLKKGESKWSNIINLIERENHEKKGQKKIRNYLVILP